MIGFVIFIIIVIVVVTISKKNTNNKSDIKESNDGIDFGDPTMEEEHLASEINYGDPNSEDEHLASEINFGNPNDEDEHLKDDISFGDPMKEANHYGSDYIDKPIRKGSNYCPRCSSTLNFVEKKNVYYKVCENKKCRYKIKMK